jgi:hypothetical protein
MFKHYFPVSFLCLSTVLARPSIPLVVQDDALQAPFADVKVPVTLGVMSQCPDALLCEALFDQVLKAKQIRDKVDLSLLYIAKYDEDDITCLHGPQECAGNIQQLCVKKYTDASQWWDFVQCQNFQGRAQIGSLETARKCAGTAQFDWELSGVGECAGLDGSGTVPEGLELLAKSAKAAKELGIE